MPSTDRRRVRRESCRADAVTRRADADVEVLRALAVAIGEVAVSIERLTDVVETGLAEVAEAIRTKEEPL